MENGLLGTGVHAMTREGVCGGNRKGRVTREKNVVITETKKRPLCSGLFNWWALRDSNSRPSRCKRDALAS